MEYNRDKTIERIKNEDDARTAELKKAQKQRGWLNKIMKRRWEKGRNTLDCYFESNIQSSGMYHTLVSSYVCIIISSTTFMEFILILDLHLYIYIYIYI
jgi:hypothetical protein